LYRRQRGSERVEFTAGKKVRQLQPRELLQRMQRPQVAVANANVL
jgi:hypothetical protein